LGLGRGGGSLLQSRGKMYLGPEGTFEVIRGKGRRQGFGLKEGVLFPATEGRRA